MRLAPGLEVLAVDSKREKKQEKKNVINVPRSCARLLRCEAAGLWMPKSNSLSGFLLGKAGFLMLKVDTSHWSRQAASHRQSSLPFHNKSLAQRGVDVKCDLECRLQSFLEGRGAVSLTSLSFRIKNEPLRVALFVLSLRYFLSAARCF